MHQNDEDSFIIDLGFALRFISAKCNGDQIILMNLIINWGTGIIRTIKNKHKFHKCAKLENPEKKNNGREREDETDAGNYRRERMKKECSAEQFKYQIA